MEGISAHEHSIVTLSMTVSLEPSFKEYLQVVIAIVNVE